MGSSETGQFGEYGGPNMKQDSENSKPFWGGNEVDQRAFERVPVRKRPYISHSLQNE